MAHESGLEYACPDENEVAGVGALLSQSLHFNMTADKLQQWIERAGAETFRLVRTKGQMAAGLRIIQAGQWYGGAKVPAIAVNALGTAPEHRGQGAGAHLLQKMHEEVHERGFPLSVLFPSNLGFYRRSGYERGGAWNTYEVPADALPVGDRALDIVRAGEADIAEFRRVSEIRARHTNGHLDRWPQMWERLMQAKEPNTFHYLVQREGQTEGYVIFAQGGQTEPTKIADVCALTQEAAMRLLTFFADDRSMTSALQWRSGPNDPLLYLLPEKKERLTRAMDWVVPIVDVEKALALRGYPEGLNAELHLEVRDERLPWNAGRFVLELADGQPAVRRGGEGRVRLDIRGLSTLYTGYLTPVEMKLAGLLEGLDRDLITTQLAFSGPRPWMPDIF